MDQKKNQILFEGNASAFIFDLRNSTKVVRVSSEKNCLTEHVNFMLELNSKILNSLANLGIAKKFAFNDTGDGCLCIFWDRNHALTCLKVAIDIYQYLNIALEEHNQNLIERFNAPTLRFGMGLHTGHYCIERIDKEGSDLDIAKDYIFGTV